MEEVTEVIDLTNWIAAKKLAEELSVSVRTITNYKNVGLFDWAPCYYGRNKYLCHPDAAKQIAYRKRHGIKGGELVPT